MAKHHALGVLVESAIVFLFLKYYQAPSWGWAVFWTVATIFFIAGITVDVSASQHTEDFDE